MSGRQHVEYASEGDDDLEASGLRRLERCRWGSARFGRRLSDMVFVHDTLYDADRADRLESRSMDAVRFAASMTCSIAGPISCTVHEFRGERERGRARAWLADGRVPGRRTTEGIDIELVAETAFRSDPRA